MASVFVKRYPSKGELPKEDDIWYDTNIGYIKFDISDKKWLVIGGIVTWWLEEIELPSEEDIYNAPNWDSMLASFRNGANFILNKLK